MNLVENEDQEKKMKSIAFQEQVQEKGIEGETRCVDLDVDTLFNVFSRVDENLLGRAACVNKLWLKAAQDERLWKPISTRLLLSSGGYGFSDALRKVTHLMGGFRRFHSSYLWPLSKPRPSDFYSIDPQVFQIQPFSDITSASMNRMGPDFPTIVLPGVEIWWSPQAQLRLRFKVEWEARKRIVWLLNDNFCEINNLI